MRSQVTLREVAAAAKVSVATASRTLNGRCSPYVSEATKKAVLDAAKRLGYRPNRLARALVTGRRNMIGLAVPYVGYPFASAVMKHIQERLHPAGLGLIAQGAEVDAERYAEDMRVIEAEVDGIIAVERVDLLRHFLELSRPRAVPIVSVGAEVAEELDHVAVDLYTGAVEACRHLASVGCRRIAYAVPAVSFHPQEQRLRAYERAVREFGMEPEHIVVPVGTRQGAREAIKEYACQCGLPDGIFCCNDVTAIGIFRGLRDLGVDVPEQCALVGCDGVEDTECFDPPISTIVQPIEEMCRMACEFLLNRIKEPDKPRQMARLQAALVVRGSSARR